MIEQLKKIIKEIIEDNGEKFSADINNESRLIDLGLSSFDLATLTVRVEDEFDIDIFEDGLVSTFGEIVKILEANI